MAILVLNDSDQQESKILVLINASLEINGCFFFFFRLWDGHFGYIN